MTRAGQKHPPKKKARSKPRPDPVAPLSDEERVVRAQSEIDKAFMHLREAELLAKNGSAPNACVHSAYYAMYHCASAGLLAAGGVGRLGDVPKNHADVRQEFGKLVAGQSGILGQTGQMLSDALTDRMVADYVLDRSATVEIAKETTQNARLFLEACSKRWTLVPSR